MNGNNFSVASSESGKNTSTNSSRDGDKSVNKGSTSHSRNDKTNETDDTGCSQKDSKNDGAEGNNDDPNGHHEKGYKRSGNSLECQRKLDSGGGIDHNNRPTYAPSSEGENVERLRHEKQFNGRGHSNSSDCKMKPQSNGERQTRTHPSPNCAKSKTGEQPVDSDTNNNTTNDKMNDNYFSDARSESGKDTSKNSSRDGDKSVNEGSTGHSRKDTTDETVTECDQRDSKINGTVEDNDDPNGHNEISDKRSGNSLECQNILDSGGGIDHNNRPTYAPSSEGENVERIRHEKQFNGKVHSNSSDCKMKPQNGSERYTEQHPSRTRCRSNSGEQPLDSDTNNETPNRFSGDGFDPEESAWRRHSSGDGNTINKGAFDQRNDENDDVESRSCPEDSNYDGPIGNEYHPTAHDPEPRHVDAATGLQPGDHANESEHERTETESGSLALQWSSVESRANPDVRPKRQDFSNYFTRVRSYEHAPDLQAKKDRLAEAGLYYSGPRALLTCFSCGIILDCHDTTTKLWKLHAFCSPDFAYLRQIKGERLMRRAVRKFNNQESIAKNNVQDNEVIAEHPATGRNHQSSTWTTTSSTQRQAFPTTAQVCTDASRMSRSDDICVSAVMPVVTRYNQGCLCITMSEQNFFPASSSSKEDLLKSLESVPLSFEEMQTFLDLFPLLRGCKVYSNFDLPRPCPILTNWEMMVFVVYEDARSRGGLEYRLGHFIAVQINRIMSNEAHITIFDHLQRRNNELNHYTLRLIANLLELPLGTILTVHTFPVQYQLLHWDCGPFVLNDIIHIRQGKEDRLRARFDQTKIRSHLRLCVQNDTCTCLDSIQCEHDEPGVTHSYSVNQDGSVVIITVIDNETI